jgi:hypothetical protein
MAPRDAVIDTRSFASAEALAAHLNSLVHPPSSTSLPSRTVHGHCRAMRSSKYTCWRD